MAYAYEQIEEHMRSAGFRIAPLESGQGARACANPTESYHCLPRASARDWGDAAYGTDGCWEIYNHLLQYAQGPNWILEELFWRDLAWKRGARIGAIAGHFNHVHSALGIGRELPIVEVPKPAPPVAYENALLLN